MKYYAIQCMLSTVFAGSAIVASPPLISPTPTPPHAPKKPVLYSPATAANVLDLPSPPGSIFEPHPAAVASNLPASPAHSSPPRPAAYSPRAQNALTSARFAPAANPDAHQSLYLEEGMALLQGPASQPPSPTLQQQQHQHQQQHAMQQTLSREQQGLPPITPRKGLRLNLSGMLMPQLSAATRLQRSSSQPPPPLHRGEEAQHSDGGLSSHLLRPVSVVKVVELLVSLGNIFLTLGKRLSETQVLEVGC